MTKNHGTSDDVVWRERRDGGDGETRPFRGGSLDSAYQRDRARVIHAAAFRSLQGKTQILKLGEGDFYRTRLTHSLEVAQIASGVATHLLERYQDDAALVAWIPSMSLIEAVGLAHDIGHPPFGHGGETALNYHLWDRGGFEGNGQTLRIVTRLGEYSPSDGLNLTRRTLLGLVKYPALHRDLADYGDKMDNDAAGTLNIQGRRPPKCVLDDDGAALDWILDPLSLFDRKLFQTVAKVQGTHGRTGYSSFDSGIMNLADDIAYGVHDFEDALALRLVSFQEWKAAVVEPAAALGGAELCGNIDFYNRKLFSDDDRERKHAISRLVYYFISNIEVETDAQFEAPLLRYRAVMAQPASGELELLKNFVFTYVIQSPSVQAAEFKGQQMLLRLFAVLLENPDRLLPKHLQAACQQGLRPHRMIADYLASMTDAGAARCYVNLFTPNMGSFFNRF